MITIENKSDYNRFNERFWELLPSVINGDRSNSDEFVDIGKALILYEEDREIFRIISLYENS